MIPGPSAQVRTVRNGDSRFESWLPRPIPLALWAAFPFVVRD